MPPQGQTKPVDYDAIAKRYGGKVTTEDIVAKYGGTIGEPDAPAGAPATTLQIAPGTSPQAAIEQMKAYNQEQGLGAQQPQGGWLDALGNVVYGAGKAAVGTIGGLAQTMWAPVETGRGLVEAQIDQFSQAKDLAGQGRYIEAGGHALAGATPLVGPAAAHAGETIVENPAEGLGEAAFLLGTSGLPSVAKGTAQGVRLAGKTGAGRGLASLADQIAEQKFVEAVAPKGSSKATLKLNNQAADAAAEVLREPGMGAMSRSGFLSKVQQKVKDLGAKFDELADQRNTGHAFASKPIIEQLKQKRQSLMMEAVEGSEVARATTERPTGLVDPSGRPATITEQTAVPLGEDVAPGPSSVRIAQIDKAIAELEKLGPLVRYDALKKMRQSWDAPANAVYSPTMTPDYSTKFQEARGAADVTGALREGLAKIDPDQAKANIPYSLWKNIETVAEVAEELDRAKPHVGRKIAAQVSGAIAGHATGGGLASVVGAILGKMVEGSVPLSPTTKLMTARTLTQLAEALRKGDVAMSQKTLQRLRAISLIGQGQPAAPKEPE